MIEASITWTDHERYVGAATSRHSIVMDTATEKTANTPMELVLIALCGCTASDVVGILRKKRERFTGLEVRATGERADGYPASTRRSISLTSFMETYQQKRCKMRCACRKKSIAPCRPCWRRRRRLLTPLSMLREERR